MRSASATAKISILALLLLIVALLQWEYDAARGPISLSAVSSSASPFAVRLVDMGFHPAVASFLWATTMPEILDLWNKKTEYFTDLAFVNAVDPKMSYPYAFSVLTLSAVPSADYPDATAQGDAIGLEGLANADPDWRIPYYLAMNEYLYEDNEQEAVWYFNIAADTPGVPQYAERFSLNFGVETNQRQNTEQLWQTIEDSSNDPDTKARAQAYIEHLQDFDYLDAASAQYKKQFGVYPTSPEELVAKGIIPSVPIDPFGFTFIIQSDGTSAIDLNTLPSYISAEPAQ
jgi:hypothetical protein